ncbi:MAG: hypothetical protein GX909_01120 [Clostridiaceae bacterium]|nr:hypothetical protein [Clostridiaceae bacterium]
MAKTSIKNTKRKASRKQKEIQGTTAFHSVLVFFRYNPFGKFLIGLIIFVLLILFNILITRNDLEMFSLITGIEFVITMIIGWTIFLLKRNVNPDDEDN